MKFHIITIGSPKLDYAKRGWAEYLGRLQHYHQVKVTHLLDRKNDAKNILGATGNSCKVGLVINGEQFNSRELSGLLDKFALEGKEVSFLIGGPDGLPQEVIDKCDMKWSFGKLTFPHDLAMVMLLEALYRASTISAGRPYHR